MIKCEAIFFFLNHMKGSYIKVDLDIGLTIAAVQQTVVVQ